MKTYPSALSIFNPTAEQLAAIGFNRKLEEDECIQWMGTPSHFRVWFWLLGIICIFGALTFEYVVLAYDQHVSNSASILSTSEMAKLLFESFITSLSRPRTYAGWSFLLFVLSAISWPVYSLGRQVLYTVSQKRVSIVVGDHGKFCGAALWVARAERFNRMTIKASDGNFDLSYQQLHGTFLVGGPVYKTLLFDFENVLPNRNIKSSSEPILPSKQIQPSNFLTVILLKMLISLFRPRVGVTDRLQSVRDARRVSELIDRNWLNS